MSGIAAHVVSGPRGSGKSALIGRLVTERAGWLGFVNAQDPRYSHPMLLLAPAGCPCCTARVAMQVALARALRETRPQRVLIEIASIEHLAALQRVLCAEPLGRYLLPGHALRLPEDAAITGEALERS